MNQFTRKTVNFVDFKTFHIKNQRFEKQYSNIYKARLETLRNGVLERAKNKWGKIFPCSNI